MINYVFLTIFGLCAGISTAAGYFAVISSIGVITRFADYTSTENKIHLYENMLIAGVITGNIFLVMKPDIAFGSALYIIYGSFAGIFTGCFLISIAEALKGIPVFFRRINLKNGLAYIILFFALGKGIGSLFYFIH